MQDSGAPVATTLAAADPHRMILDCQYGRSAATPSATLFRDVLVGMNGKEFEQEFTEFFTNAVLKVRDR